MIPPSISERGSGDNTGGECQRGNGATGGGSFTLPFSTGSSIGHRMMSSFPSSSPSWKRTILIWGTMPSVVMMVLGVSLLAVSSASSSSKDQELYHNGVPFPHYGTSSSESTTDEGSKRKLSVKEFHVQGLNTRHLEEGSDELVKRCFEDCQQQHMSPMACQHHIEREIVSANYPVKDLVVEIVPPPNTREFPNYKLPAGQTVQVTAPETPTKIRFEKMPTLKIPTDLHGYVACDQHEGIIKYPHTWIPAHTQDANPDPINIVAQCAGMLASECCYHLSKLAGGPNTHGQCLHCVAVQQPLVPTPYRDGTSGFQDFSFDSQAHTIEDSCQPNFYTTPQVHNIDMASKELAQQDEMYVRNFRNRDPSSISCHELAQLEGRMIVHTRAVPAAQRYIGALTCEFCDPVTGYVKNFERLLANLAEAFYYLETTNVDSAVAKVLIYTQLEVDPLQEKQALETGSEVMPEEVIWGTPQIAIDRIVSSHPEDGTEDDCDESTPLKMQDPPSLTNTNVLSTGYKSYMGGETPYITTPTTTSGGNTTTPGQNTPMDNGGTIPGVGGENKGGNEEEQFYPGNNDICGIDTSSDKSDYEFSLSHAGELKQQCRSTLPEDLMIATANIVQLTNKEYLGEGSECKTRLTYKVCNYMHSEGKRFLRSLIKERPDAIRHSHEDTDAVQEYEQVQKDDLDEIIMPDFVRLELEQERLDHLNGSHHVVTSSHQNLRETMAMKSGFAGGGGGFAGFGFGKLPQKQAPAPAPAPVSSSSSNTNRSSSTTSTSNGHIMLGWVGACRVLDYGITSGSESVLDRAPFMLQMMDGKVDEETCMTGVYVDPSRVSGRECIEVAMEYQGHVDVSVPKDGMTPAGATLSYFGHYKLLKHLPIADCRHTPSSHQS